MLIADERILIMKKKKIVVEGFAFTEKEMAKKAFREAENVQYVREHLDMENPWMVLEMYRKLTAEKVFQTPVGIMFLKELWNYLSNIPEFKEEELEPISFFELPNPVLSKQDKKLQEDFSKEEEAAVEYEEKLEQEKQKRRAVESKQIRIENKLKDHKKYLRFSIVGNIFLIFVVIGMIVITLSDDHPNIINYENKIIDKYTKWEQELEKREQKVKELEKN